MATIVKHRRTAGRYVLLGTGFGAYKATRPGVIFGNLLPAEDAGEVTMAAVCDADGRIGWTASDDLQVVEIEGRSPADILNG